MRLDSLEFFGRFAEIQMRNGGVGQYVTPKTIIALSGLPRTTMYHHLNTLMARGYIVRLKRGQYSVAWNKTTVGIGLSVINFWDMLEYNNAMDDFLAQFSRGAI